MTRKSSISKRKRTGSVFPVLGSSLCIVAAAVVLIVIGSFGYPVYTYTENTKVLLYHLVSDETYGPNEYLFVRVADFESQLAEIKRLGYETVFADELSQTRGKKCVVLTFDDGYEDNFTNVLPLLEKYDMKATVFLISDMIGTEGHLSEEQIREMAASGRIHFGSHTKSHQKLYALGSDEMELELVESRRRIEELTGMKVTALAYPNGVCDAAAELAAGEVGYITASIKISTATQRTDPRKAIMTIPACRAAMS